jgi:hypothetical protein
VARLSPFCFGDPKAGETVKTLRRLPARLTYKSRARLLPSCSAILRGNDVATQRGYERVGGGDRNVPIELSSEAHIRRESARAAVRSALSAQYAESLREVDAVYIALPNSMHAD